MLKKICLYITLLSSLNGLAQPYVSVRGDFSVDQRRGCRDMFVSVTNIDPGTDVILYQFEGRGSTVTASNTYNYTTTGNYWLYQYIQGPTGEKADSLFIEVFDPEIVDFRLESCNNNDVVVSIENTTYDEYQIDYGDGTVLTVPVFGFPPPHHYTTVGPFNVTVAGLYTTANNQCGVNTRSYTPVNSVQPALITQLEVLDNATLAIDYTLAPFTSSTLEISLGNNATFQTFTELTQGSVRDTLRGLNLNNTYCLRISSNDACSNFKAYSNEVCTVTSTVNAINDAIDISWQTFFLPDFSTVNIFRNDTLVNTLNTTENTYRDSTAVCDNNYCYRVEIGNSDGGTSLSQVSCATAFSTTEPSAISNASSVVEEMTIDWTWQVPQDEAIGSFRLFNEEGIFIATTDQNSISLPINEELNCFFLEFTNNCGNTSPRSRLLCPLELEYQVGPEGSTLLTWNNYEAWSNGVNGYAVLIYDQNMVQTDSIWLGNNTSYEDPLPDDDSQVSLYRTIAVANDMSLSSSSSNLLIVERPPVISLPSSFTPNGDGLNDLFEIKGKYIDEQQLTIYDRWGGILFSSDTEGWDGTRNGNKLPAGNYVYQVRVKDFTGKEHIRTGTVLILKD